jgi:hypothetical protein
MPKKLGLASLAGEFSVAKIRDRRSQIVAPKGSALRRIEA